MSQDVPIRITLLGPGDEGRFSSVLPGVFDRPTRPELVREFLADPRHHMAVALEEDRIVGFASGVHYIHPDKGPELWINEVGVAPSHRRRGIGRRLLRALFRRGREHGCTQAWVLTERENEAARALYLATGVQSGIEEPVLYNLHLERADEG
ncbi:MAG: GNAT family N-acetyltransferase [Gemmatimonadota bacterium]|jgi:ribosomal protein S18 acetylase RimI-like enzyme